MCATGFNVSCTIVTLANCRLLILHCPVAIITCPVAALVTLQNIVITYPVAAQVALPLDDMHQRNTLYCIYTKTHQLKVLLSLIGGSTVAHGRSGVSGVEGRTGP